MKSLPWIPLLLALALAACSDDSSAPADQTEDTSDVSSDGHHDDSDTDDAAEDSEDADAEEDSEDVDTEDTADEDTDDSDDVEDSDVDEDADDSDSDEIFGVEFASTVGTVSCGVVVFKGEARRAKEYAAQHNGEEE